LPQIKTIQAQVHRSYALTFDGQVYVWGNNEEGYLCLGDYNNRNFPTIIEGLPHIKQIYTQYESLTMLTTKGKIYDYGVINYDGDNPVVTVVEDCSFVGVYGHRILIRTNEGTVKYVSRASKYSGKITVIDEDILTIDNSPITQLQVSPFTNQRIFRDEAGRIYNGNERSENGITLIKVPLY
jgi:hypothetical protein